MKKCTNCGNSVTDDTNFCPDCGNSAFEPVEASSDTPQTNDNVSPLGVVEKDRTQSVRSAFEQSEQIDTGIPDADVITQQPYSPISDCPTPENTAPTVYTVPQGYTEDTLVNNKQEQTNVGLAVLSGFVPLVGFILYFVKKKDEPKTAKACGKTALIVTIVSILLSIIISVLTFVGTVKLLDSPTISESYSYSDSESNDEATMAKDKSDTASSPVVSANFASTKYADLDNRQFSVNGKVYTLGKTTLQDMINDGVPFNEDDIANASNNVNGNTQTDFDINLDEYWSATVYVGNYTDENKVAKDCVVTEISYHNSDDKTQNILGFNFPLTLTEEELKNNSGEPTENRTYSSEGYTTNTYEYKTESTRYYGNSGYTFEFTNGQLERVSIEYMP